MPILGLAFETDPETTQEAANRLIERIVDAIASILIGELAGVAAGTVLDTSKTCSNDNSRQMEALLSAGGQLVPVSPAAELLGHLPVFPVSLDFELPRPAPRRDARMRGLISIPSSGGSPSASADG